MLMQMSSKNIAVLKDPGFLVIDRKYRLGRKAECAFVVDHLSISRIHAELIVKTESVLIKDLGSMNGTYVDGLRITEAEVKSGQAVRFGVAEFRLVGHELADIGDPSTVAPYGDPVLSEAQQRVLELLLKGCSEKEAANQLGISPNTVHSHVRQIYLKYKVSSRAELLALFVSESKIREQVRQ